MIAIFLAKDEEKINTVYKKDQVEKRLGALGKIEFFSKEDVLKKKDKFTNVRFIFSTWYMPSFSEQEIKELFPVLEAVFYAAGTVKYFAEPFLNAGIRVYSAASANAIPVAEFTVSQIVLANKGYYQAQLECKKPFFKLSYQKAYAVTKYKVGNYNASIGLIGAGAVGKKVIELLAPYKMSIYVTDPYLSDNDATALNVKKVDIEELFRKCDVISNHLPNIPETKGMLNYKLFSMMKDGATFINTGRGAQVIEKDLVRVLKKKKYCCALLDVTSHEPLWPWSPLNRTKNVFLTPHIAGSISQEEQRMAEYMYRAFDSYLKGQNDATEVNLEMIAKMT